MRRTTRNYYVFLDKAATYATAVSQPSDALAACTLPPSPSVARQRIDPLALPKTRTQTADRGRHGADHATEALTADEEGNRPVHNSHVHSSVQLFPLPSSCRKTRPKATNSQNALPFFPNNPTLERSRQQPQHHDASFTITIAIAKRLARLDSNLVAPYAAENKTTHTQKQKQNSQPNAFKKRLRSSEHTALSSLP